MSRSDSSSKPDPVIEHAARLAAVFHRRWKVSILAQLHAEHGSRFVSLAHRLGASEGALRVTLDEMIRDGLVTPNPGYGHPLRPEYILTPAGLAIAPACGRVDTLVRSLDLQGVLFKKWSMPVLYVVGRGPTRFSQVTQTLRDATDRAVAIALKDLSGAGVVDRRVEDGYPPTSAYLASRVGRNLAGMLAEM